MAMGIQLLANNTPSSFINVSLLFSIHAVRKDRIIEETCDINIKLVRSLPQFEAPHDSTAIELKINIRISIRHQSIRNRTANATTLQM